MYPDDAIQSLVQPWWVADKSNALARGRLVYAYALRVEASAFALVPEGRKEPTDPSRARMRVEPLNPGAPPRAPNPPSPALPLEPGEAWCVHRARRRACIVVGAPGVAIRRPSRTEAPEITVGPAVLLAPFHDAAGLDAAFVARVRRGEYGQYVWDRLPFPGGGEAVLRLDLLQPASRDPAALEWTDFALAPAALAVLDQWLAWALTGVLAPAGTLHEFRELARGG